MFQANAALSNSMIICFRGAIRGASPLKMSMVTISIWRGVAWRRKWEGAGWDQSGVRGDLVETLTFRVTTLKMPRAPALKGVKTTSSPHAQAWVHLNGSDPTCSAAGSEPRAARTMSESPLPRRHGW